MYDGHFLEQRLACFSRTPNGDMLRCPDAARVFSPLLGIVAVE